MQIKKSAPWTGFLCLFLCYISESLPPPKFAPHPPNNKTVIPYSVLVIIGMIRIGEIKNNRAMRFCPTAVGELLLEIDKSVKVKAAILVDIDIQRFVVCWGVDDPNVARLDEIVCYHDVFLVWGDFDVVGANCWLNFIRVVQTFGIVQVGYVEGGNVVGCCYCCWGGERGKEVELACFAPR